MNTKDNINANSDDQWAREAVASLVGKAIEAAHEFDEAADDLVQLAREFRGAK